MNENIIGIDIGATKTHIGVVRESKIIREVKFPTASKASKEEIISVLIQEIEKIGGSNFSGIGIGVPGLVDEEKGIIYDLANIPSWKEVNLKEQLEEYFQKPVEITNDANIFALGVKRFGNGNSYKNLVGITLGSGFGTGIIINHEVYSGNLSSAGELGDIPYLDKTIEDYCSGKFFRDQHGLDGSEVFKLAEQADPYALEIFHQYGSHLGNALKIIVGILSPEAIFLGGSVSKSFKYFEAALQEKIDSFPLKKITGRLVIEPSRTPNVSIFGSAALIPNRQLEQL